jgi:hypothetical protein
LVLEAFIKSGLYLKRKKYKFHQQQVKFIGLIISMDRLKMVLEEIHAIQHWGPPNNLTDIHVFLGIINFYCYFIYYYSWIMHPLTFLTWQWIPFPWNEEEQKAFHTLRDTFILVPILAYFDPDWDVIVETNPSDYITAMVLWKYHDYYVVNSVTYCLTKPSPAECNYEICDQKLMAIVLAFEE